MKSTMEWIRGERNQFTENIFNFYRVYGTTGIFCLEKCKLGTMYELKVPKFRSPNITSLPLNIVSTSFYLQQQITTETISF